MKLLTWMHRKFRQGNGETLKEFSLGGKSQLSGQPMVDDSHLYQNQKQNQGRQRRSSFTSVETTKYSELEQKVSSATTDEFPEYFDGFLAIGTLGNETVISEPETPTFAVSFEKLAEGEAEVTKNELRLINDELERVLAVEAKDDGWTDSSGRNSHVSNGRISHASSTITLSGKPLEIPETTGNNNNNLMNCPLQEYLLGSAVELPVAEKASVPKKENRTSLGELFERHKAEENPETKYKRAEKREDKEGDKTAASMNLMKKILTKKKNALHAPSRNSSASSRPTAESASTDTKLCKILQKFHKKVHPECLISSEKSDKMYKNGTKDNDVGYYKHEHTIGDESSATFSQKAGQNGYMLRISNPSQYTEDGNDSNGSRECWIKTDADYLVLEL